MTPEPAHTHTIDGSDEVYQHSHIDPECSHHWRACPVHTPEDGSMPNVNVVTTCIYGGAELKDGGTWNDDTSKEVWDRVLKKMS